MIWFLSTSPASCLSSSPTCETPTKHLKHRFLPTKTTRNVISKPKRHNDTSRVRTNSNHYTALPFRHSTAQHRAAKVAQVPVLPTLTNPPIVTTNLHLLPLIWFVYSLPEMATRLSHKWHNMGAVRTRDTFDYYPASLQKNKRIRHNPSTQIQSRTDPRIRDVIVSSGQPGALLSRRATQYLPSPPTNTRGGTQIKHKVYF